MEIELDSILQCPEKLLPLITEFDKYRYFLIEGGRGGGKSQIIGRWLLHLSELYNLRVVCGREIQNSIKESVYSLLADLIVLYRLNYIVLAKSIIHRVSKSEINFRGFREQGAFNIQGMEAIDIVWIDESQAITKQTLDVLIPTIRKDTAKVIFSMNRFVRNDPVYAQFIGRDDCLHIHLNYNDNPFCTAALKKEAEECKKKSESDYNHIWLGLPLDKTEDAVFTHTEMESVKRAEHKQRLGYGCRIGGFDIARFGDDKCACVILQQQGALHWAVVHVSQWDHKDAVFTQGRIAELVREWKLDKAIIDVDGLGGPYYDNLVYGTKGLYEPFRNPSISFLDNHFYGNNRTVNTYKLKDLISKDYIHIKDDGLLDELETMRYEFDHNQRRILVSKERMKKNGVKSPNMADACIMAVSLIDDIKRSQDNEYAPQMREAPDDNLFKIAGVR